MYKVIIIHYITIIYSYYPGMLILRMILLSFFTVNDIVLIVSSICRYSRFQAAIYGMAQSIPDRSLVGEIAGTFFDAYYSTKRGLANGHK
jgi:hypothetical protein